LDAVAAEAARETSWRFEKDFNVGVESTEPIGVHRARVLRDLNGPPGALHDRGQTPSSQTQGLTSRGVAAARPLLRNEASLWADRLLGDAAAELRVPLDRVGDSLRSVLAGDLGALNPTQRACLRDALSACEQVDTMVMALRRLNRRRHGQGAINRCWFDVATLCGEVERVIQRALPNRQVMIRWHGFTDSVRHAFGDPAMAVRLLAGLIESAIRGGASDGKAIWVRAAGVPQQSVLRISVTVEDGCFFGVAARRSDRLTEGQKAYWVEFAVWRQLAAALMTQTELRMRPNGGWEMAFELPVDGPSAVVSQWVRWRLCQTSKTVPRRKELAAEGTEPSNETTAVWLRQHVGATVGPGPLHQDRAAVLTVVAGAAVSVDAIEAFHRKIQEDLGLYDFAYRVSPRRWVLVWDVNGSQARTRIEMLATGNLDSASPIRLHWSVIGNLPIRDGQTARILADRLTRELLTDSDAGSITIDELTETTAALSPSTVPSERLRAEMRHLAARVRVQNEHLQNQARQLRLPAGG